MTDLVKLEKSLCSALRHKPESFGLTLDENGFADANSVCIAFGISRDALDQIVEQSDKKRFELEGNRIRALYGHSVSSRIKKEEIVPPEYLYHGTSRKAAEIILVEGLKPMRRQYVHLSYDTDIAYEVGKRKDSRPVVLQINARAAHENGIVFYSGNERNVLVDYIPVEYISIADVILKIEDLNEDCIAGMAVLDRNDSGLPYDLWLLPEDRVEESGNPSPRLYVKVKDELVPFMIEKDDGDVPESAIDAIGRTELDLIRQYVREYRKILVSHWNGRLTDRQVLNSLDRIRKKE